MYIIHSTFKYFYFIVYPIMGNHESFPCNVYDYEGDREKELKTEFANAWEYWIGPEAAEEFK